MRRAAETMKRKLGATPLYGEAYSAQVDAIWYEADKATADAQRLGETVRELARRYYG